MGPDAAGVEGPVPADRAPLAASAAGPSALRVGLGALAVSLLVAVPALGVNLSYLGIAAAAIILGLVLSRLEERPARATMLTLFVWALVLRMTVLTACVAVALRDGGPFLGPDSMDYFQSSMDLAARNFQTDTVPVIYFGTYDVGQFYLFATAVRLFSADLFGLQVLNSALTALAVPLTYSLARALVPRGAHLVALTLVAHPSLIGLSSLDLLKDPSIVCAMVGLLWALVHLTRPLAWWRLGAFAGVAFVCAMYLRTSRFYAFAYIEVAFVAALIILRHRGAWPYRSVVGFAASALIFLTVELLPTKALWPVAPAMIASMASYTLDTPAMRAYAPGFFDRLQGRGAARGARKAPGETPPEEWRAGLLSIPANAFRRLFGPFPWIPPDSWRFRALQTGQYYLFPGMVIWYALLPVIAAGLVRSAAAVWRGTEQHFGLLLLLIFTLVYFAQYMAINLSYRQRDVMLPLLLIFGWKGLVWARSTTWASRWYRVYWMALGMLAAAHTAVRAVFA